jgi:uncharacterized membrane protein
MPPTPAQPEFVPRAGALDRTGANVDGLKLDGVAAGATANSADATLLARANHTGTQATNTVTGLDAALAAKQALDATLTALAGVATAADKLIYATGSDAFSTTDITAFARTVLATANAAAARAALALGSAAGVTASRMST